MKKVYPPHVIHLYSGPSRRALALFGLVISALIGAVIAVKKSGEDEPAAS